MLFDYQLTTLLHLEAAFQSGSVLCIECDIRTRLDNDVAFRFSHFHMRASYDIVTIP